MVIESYIDKHYKEIAESILDRVTINEDENGVWLYIPKVSLYAWRNTIKSEWVVNEGEKPEGEGWVRTEELHRVEKRVDIIEKYIENQLRWGRRK